MVQLADDMKFHAKNERTFIFGPAPLNSTKNRVGDLCACSRRNSCLPLMLTLPMRRKICGDRGVFPFAPIVAAAQSEPAPLAVICNAVLVGSYHFILTWQGGVLIIRSNLL